MKVLQYINEHEKHKPPDMSNPIVREAANRLKQVIADYFWEPTREGPYDHGGCRIIAGALWAIAGTARGIPYADPDIAENARQSLKRYSADAVLNEKNYTPFGGKLLLHCPGIGSWAASIIPASEYPSPFVVGRSA